MPRSVTRELTVTYNDLTMGGSDEDHRITGFIRMRQEPEVGQAEWDVLVVGSTESAFTATCVNFEEKMSEPWNDIKITQGSSTLLDVKASDTENTALNPSITVQKVGTTTDTGRTRRYHCVATWGRPADYPNADSVGLRDYDVLVSYTPARRASVSISGTYTAVTTNLARAQYDAKIAAFATAVLTAISASATFELVEEDSSHDVNNKTLEFSRIYDEVIFTQGTSGADNANIVSQTLEISVGRLGATAHPDKAGESEALGNVVVAYSAWFDKDQTTNLEGEWDSLRNWLITQANDKFSGTTALSLISEAPVFDPVENKLTVSMTFQGAQQGEYLQVRFTTEDQVEYGLASVHAWGGGAFDKYLYQAEAHAVRTVRMTAVKRGHHSRATAIDEFASFAGLESLAGGAGGGVEGGELEDVAGAPHTNPLSGDGGKWYSRSRRVFADPYTIGVSGDQETFTQMTGEAVRFWAKPVETATTRSNDGGGPPAVTP